MTEKGKKIIRVSCDVVLSVLTIVCGILLIVQTQRIYHSAEDSPYSYAKVSSYLSEIAWVLYIWIAAVIACGIVNAVVPRVPERVRATVYSTALADRLLMRLPTDSRSKFIDRTELIKKISWIVAIVVSVLSVIMVSIVVLDPSNYTPFGTGFNPTEDILKMLPKILPYIGASFLFAVIATVYCELASKAEIKEIKRLLVESKGGVKPSENKKNALPFRIPDIFKDKKVSKYSLLAARIALAVTAVVLIIVGAFNGGLEDLLEKAINICTECIGLG